MKLTALLAASLLSAAATQAFAADAVMAPSEPMMAPAASNAISGYGELFVGYGWGSDNDSDNWNYVPYGGAARINFWLTPTWNLQADAWVNHLHGSDYDYDYNSGGGAVHLGMRTSDYYFGGLASYGSNGDLESDAYTLGLEAQAYMGNFTLYGQGGYSATTNGRDGDAWYLHGAVRYFIDPNLMLEANAGYASESIDYMGTYENDQTRWGAKIEWKPKADLPISVYGAYQGHHDSWNSGYRLTSHTVMVGLRVMFGQNSLLDNDRKGASLVDYNPIYGVNEAWDAY